MSLIKGPFGLPILRVSDKTDRIAPDDPRPDKTEPENFPFLFDHFTGAKSALDQISAGLDLQ